jgi:hypothetical protein
VVNNWNFATVESSRKHETSSKELCDLVLLTESMKLPFIHLLRRSRNLRLDSFFHVSLLKA